MKILFYNHAGQVSGAERSLLTILSRLDRTRFDCLLVCPAQGPLLKMAEDQGATCQSINTLKARFTWRVDLLLRYLTSLYRTVYQLRKMIVDASPDVVHANSVRAGLVATAATVGLQTPVIWHLRDLLPRHPEHRDPLFCGHRPGYPYGRNVASHRKNNFCGRVYGWTRGCARIRVIFDGIELDEFKPRASIENLFSTEDTLNPAEPKNLQMKAASRQAICEGLDISHAGPVIGIVGQVTPWKGQLGLLRAFAEVLKQVPQAVLLVVGAPLFNRDHKYLELLTETAGSLGIADRVHFLGQRHDVAAIMREMDLLIVNSRAEPFGLVVIESMASGTPVLGTAAGGIPEIINHGESGWLVPPGDERALAAAIIHLINQPQLCAQLAARGRQQVELRFSVERFIRELEEFYQQVCCPQESREAQAKIKSKNLNVEI